MHDYVIVGASPAGCVLARRLSEPPDVRVLLLEANGTPRPSPSPFQNERDWRRTTAPQAHLLGRTLYWPRGKMLGGSSALDATIALRGHPADYDGWAARYGGDGWSYAEVLPYFKRLETNARGASRSHGGQGPLHVADLAAPHRLTQAIVRAAIDAGFPYRSDLGTGVPDGVALNQVLQKDGKRHSAAAAYLDPIRHRANLDVITGARVQEVEIEDGRATGVTYEEDGIAWSAEAHAEVILCAGAIGSPQLLMLSGVGPAAHLEARDISVVCDLAGVGRNLQDHLATPVCYALRGEATPRAKVGAWPSVTPPSLAGSGPFASSVGEASIFLRTQEQLDAPDVQLHAAPLSYRDHAFESLEGEALTLNAALLQPASSGTLTLHPDAPAAAPVIQPRYCSDPADRDLATLVTAVRRARGIFARPPFARYHAWERLPGSGKTTDAALRSHVRLESETLCHPAGTCAMGGDASPLPHGAVVDAKLRVRGVERLRVVDASVMPRIPRGNTTLPAIMIGEKAADLIRGRALLPPEDAESLHPGRRPEKPAFVLPPTSRSRPS